MRPTPRVRSFCASRRRRDRCRSNTSSVLGQPVVPPLEAVVGLVHRVRDDRQPHAVAFGPRDERARNDERGGGEPRPRWRRFVAVVERNPPNARGRATVDPWYSSVSNTCFACAWSRSNRSGPVAVMWAAIPVRRSRDRRVRPTGSVGVPRRRRRRRTRRHRRLGCGRPGRSPARPDSNPLAIRPSVALPDVRSIDRDSGPVRLQPNYIASRHGFAVRE